MNKRQKKILLRILLTAALMLLCSLLPVSGVWRLALFLIPYLLIGYDILRKAGKGILRLQPFDECFLMSVATLGAFLLGEYTEGVAVMLFYQTGELFQSVAVGKSRRSIGALMDIRPDVANVEREGEVLTVSPDEVEVGSVIVVKPGERVPIDGIVLEGSSFLDTLALTGESVPRDVTAGDEIYSGCVNLFGVLRIRTVKEFGESTVSKILDLVENASSKKSRSERFIAKFARVYTPAVCISALLLALLPPLLQLLVFHVDATWGEWIYRALTFLVISCPCALVISIPLSFFAGIGGAGSAGVLIKGSNYLETLARVEHVAFDKTGTLTKGCFSVEEICAEDGDGKALLELAAHAEAFSSHPISRSLREAYGRPLVLTRVQNAKEHTGHGVSATVDGKEVLVGNAKLMQSTHVAFPVIKKSGTVAYVAVDGRYCGYLLIGDRLKPEAKEAVERLRRIGIKRILLLTGDRAEIGEAVAREVGIDEVRGDLLPEDKLRAVEQLLEEKAPGAVAFVGDGINDAPVLARADIGIAMGALGADAAIEAADVVLMDDQPMKIVKAIGIAKKCMRIVYQNIGFALGVKLLCLALGALGYADMWLAVFADVGVMVLAVLNAIRALRVKKL
ncbi:MAG: cadmium-translocating P-type ATPase [Clostridia bacterium]|nr:cadmium-translocating P-type ATPase [Clostridia bacterium]